MVVVVTLLAFWGETSALALYFDYDVADGQYDERKLSLRTYESFLYDW